MNIFKYRAIFWQLVKADLAMFQQTFWDKCLNGLIWVSATVAITTYILPAFGLSLEYGAFQAIGVIVSISGFEMYPQIMNFVADLEGDRVIDFHLTLPIPSWLLFVKWCCIFMINALLMSSIALVVSKLILLHRFDMATISIGKMIIAFMVINLFFAFFALLITSMTKSMLTMENTMMRILYPLWILGGFQFSWHVLHDYSPVFAYICLLNPYIYAMEGLRAAALGQEGYLNFCMCMAALLGFTVISGWWAIARLRKRLDFI